MLKTFLFFPFSCHNSYFSRKFTAFLIQLISACLFIIVIQDLFRHDRSLVKCTESFSWVTELWIVCAYVCTKQKAEQNTTENFIPLMIRIKIGQVNTLKCFRHRIHLLSPFVYCRLANSGWFSHRKQKKLKNQHLISYCVASNHSKFQNNSFQLFNGRMVTTHTTSDKPNP